MTDEQQPKSRRELRAAERTRQLAELERLRREAERQARADASQPAAGNGAQLVQPIGGMDAQSDTTSFPSAQVNAAPAEVQPETPASTPIAATPASAVGPMAAANDAIASSFPKLPADSEPLSQLAVDDSAAHTAQAAQGQDGAAVAAASGFEQSTPTDDAADLFNELMPAASKSDDRPKAATAEDAFAQIFGDDAVGKPVPVRRAAPPNRRRRLLGNLAIVGLILAVVLGGGALAWSVAGDRIMDFFSNSSADYEGSGNGTEVQFTVLPGDTGTDIAIRLEEQGVVLTSGAFIDAILARPDEPQFYPGTYRLQQEMSSAAALVALLDENNRIENTLTIPEGTRESDVYQLVSDTFGIPVEDLESLAADPQQFGLPEEAKSLEGFLFPATYTFDPGIDAQGVLTAMVDRSFEALDEHGVAAEDRWDIVLMASLVEREAGLADDYPKVARVFYNRLDQGMLLQSDATVTYWTEQTHRASTTDDERADASNPYNTYVHEGMIPAPISNPGDLAINAAVNPADGDWLYFVTVNLETGETVFSNTLEEHERAVEQWLQWLDENPDYE